MSFLRCSYILIFAFLHYIPLFCVSFILTIYTFQNEPLSNCFRFYMYLWFTKKYIINWWASTCSHFLSYWSTPARLMLIFFSFILQKDYYFQLICKWYVEAVKLIYIDIQLLQYHVWNHFQLKYLLTLVENQLNIHVWVYFWSFYSVSFIYFFCC